VASHPTVVKQRGHCLKYNDHHKLPPNEKSFAVMFRGALVMFQVTVVVSRAQKLALPKSPPPGPLFDSFANLPVTVFVGMDLLIVLQLHVLLPLLLLILMRLLLQLVNHQARQIVPEEYRGVGFVIAFE